MDIIVESRQIFNVKIIPSGEVRARGYISRTEAKRLGVTLCDDAVRVGVVLFGHKEPEILKIKDQPHPWQVVVREEGKYRFVTSDYYDVFDPKEQKPEEQELPLSPTVFQETSTPFPASPPTTMVKSSFSLEIVGFGDEGIVSESEPVNNVRAYVPEGLNLPDSAIPYQDKINYFVGLIWRKHVETT